MLNVSDVDVAAVVTGNVDTERGAVVVDGTVTSAEGADDSPEDVFKSRRRRTAIAATTISIAVARNFVLGNFSCLPLLKCVGSDSPFEVLGWVRTV